jgi:hypothetical protein
LSCHSVAVVLTLVHTKQIRINIHKRNNTENTVQTIQNAVNISTYITKTTTLISKHPAKLHIYYGRQDYMVWPMRKWNSYKKNKSQFIVYEERQ